MTKRRVVLTGLGSLTGYGIGLEPLWNGLLSGKTSIRPFYLDEHQSFSYPASVIDSFQPEQYIQNRKSIKVMARDIQLAVSAATLAMQDAGLKKGDYDSTRFGLVVGAGVLSHELDELLSSVQSSVADSGALDLKKFGDEGISALFPLWLLKYLPNMPACHISIQFDLQGMNNTLTTGASAGLQAVGEAYRVIQRNDADRMLAGGAESKVNPVGIAEYEVLGVLSKKTHSDTYQPFSLESDGFFVGEGAGFLLLESLDSALKRNANIYAEVVGFGASSFLAPHLSMKMALNEAGVSPKEVGYLQASANGVPADDRTEMDAIKTIWQESGESTKTAFSKQAIGFTGFASGALDAVISTLAVRNQTIPSVYASGLAKKTFHGSVAYAMTHSFGLNGQSASLITKQYLS